MIFFFLILLKGLCKVVIGKFLVQLICNVFLIWCFLSGNVTEQTGAGLNDIKDPPLFSRGSPPPTRFTFPTARGKTSLNARDW